jgi:hypothetical protein
MMVLLVFLMMGVGSVAFGKRFRLYSIISGVGLLAFGAMTFLDALRLQSNLPTPWIGPWERMNIRLFLLWMVVLAAGPLRAAKGGYARCSGRGYPRRARRRAVAEHRYEPPDVGALP